jgi:exopolysaccharide production protein ExoQ
MTLFQRRRGTGALQLGPARRDWVIAFAGAVVLADAFDASLYEMFGTRTTLLPGLPLSRVLLFVPLVAAAVLLAGHLRTAADCVRATWFLWPGVALTFVSAAWSDLPGTTLLWSAALLGTSAFGVALAVRFSPHAQATLVAVIVTCIAVGSTIAALLWPAFGIGNHGWHGLYIHKNLLGRVMALGVTALVLVALTGRGARLAQPLLRAGLGPSLVMLSLCAGVLVATRSVASVLAASIAVLAIILLLWARGSRRYASAILATGVAGTIVVMVFLLTTPSGLALLARSDTFSGRTGIWTTVTAAAMETPWIGHGYAAFWPSPAGQQTLSALQMRFPIGHAHNGLIDLFAELGLAGLVLVAVPLMLCSIAAVRHALAPRTRACLWPAAYMVFFLASNAGESALLRHKLYWALYVAAACHIARSASDDLTTPDAEP